MSAPWFRLYTDLPDCPKLRMLSEPDQIGYVWLLCLHKCGRLVDRPCGEIAFRLRLSESRVVELIDNLQTAGLLLDDRTPKGWDERQYASDSSVERVRRFRAKAQRSANDDGNDRKQAGNVTVTPSDSDSDSDSDSEAEEKIAPSSTGAADSEPDVPPVIAIPLIPKDGEFDVTADMVDEWRAAYPGVDVMATLRRIRAWCLDNPSKRKTAKGARRFVGTWLAKEQDKGGKAAPEATGRRAHW